VWDRLAACESSGNFHNQDTGNNGHFGGFQFSPATWRGVGGTGNPANASTAEQLRRAKILLARSGPGQWECKVGLTKASGAAQGLTVLNGARTVTKSAPVTATAAAKAVSFARAQLGKAYSQRNPQGPNHWDCSGLVQAAWGVAGVSLPRVAVDQWKSQPGVNPALVRAGDLVVYRGGAHIAIYIGGGKIIEAPRPGSTVRIAPFRTGWYADHFTAVVRPGGVGLPGTPLVPGTVPRARPKADPVPVPREVAKGSTHTVVKGDTLSAIAVTHDVQGGWPALYALNRGVLNKGPHWIYPRQIIRLG
jgi:cell wall-associated NlpC family hydrolase